MYAVRIGIAGSLAIALCGCAAPHYGAQSWHAGFDTVTDGDAPALTPARCLDEPDTQAPDLLPPGCVHDLNLERMVVRPSDLVRGRAMGPPLAVPIARAAQAEINGSQQHAEQRRQNAGQNDSSEASGYAAPSLSNY